MAKKTQRRQISPAALRPTPSQAATGHGHLPAGAGLLADPDGPSLLIQFIMWTHFIVLFVIVMAMTPLTNNLDDIKQTIFLVMAPLQMLLALAALLFGAAPRPNRSISIGLIGYGIVMVISTLAGKFHWMGWDQVIMNWGAAGLFLSAFCAGSWRTTSDHFVKFLTILWLVVCVIGFAMFDIFNAGQHTSVVGWLFRTIYGGPDYRDPGDLFALLLTLNNADDQLQSTILNRDFMAGLSLLFLPFPILVAIDPGQNTRHPIFWRLTGAATALLTILAIFFCRSKGEYIVSVFVSIYMLAMFLKVGHLPTLRRRHILVALAAVLMVLSALLWMYSPTLMHHLKSLNTSVGSRKIMWHGAWEIFKDFPILGGGPGSYRVYFSSHRAPDYYLHEIANVTTYSHNYFLDLLCETGIFGFGFFIVFLGSLWLMGLRHALFNKDGHIRMQMIACTASLLGIFGSNMSSPNARWIIGASTLWTVMGFMAGCVRRGDGWPEDSAAPHSLPARLPMLPRTVVTTCLAIGVVMLFFSIPSGINYFSSALKYADGLRYMDGGLREFTNGNDTEKMARMLEASVRYFEDSVKDDPTNVSAYYKVGSVYSTLSRVYEEYANQAQAAKKDAEANEFMALSHKLDDLSRERYEKLDELMPDYAEIHFNFGIVYDRYATKLRGEAMQLAGKDEIERARKESLEADARKYDKLSLDHLERMHQLSIKPEVFQMLGGQYTQMNMIDRAQAIYREGARRYTDNKEIIRKYHDISVMLNDVDGMLEALSLLWKVDPQDNQILNRLLQTALDHRKEQPLAETLDRLEKLNPLDARIFAARAVKASWDKNQRQVLEQAERYRLVGGRQPEVYQMAAAAARELGQGTLATTYEKEMARSAGTPPTGDATPPLVLQ